MQNVVSIMSPPVTERRVLTVTVISFLERTVMRVFFCWHRRMSWPRTRDFKTFRSCLKCGMCRHFDPETWKSTGPFYWDDDHKRGVGLRGL